MLCINRAYLELVWLHLHGSALWLVGIPLDAFENYPRTRLGTIRIISREQSEQIEKDKKFKNKLTAAAVVNQK